jgi:hypothetical protein
MWNRACNIYSSKAFNYYNISCCVDERSIFILDVVLKEENSKLMGNMDFFHRLVHRG